MAETRKRRLDKWVTWLKETRDQNSTAEEKEKTQRFLNEVRDHVLDGARVKAGETLLDVGAGLGLLALEAAERLGPTGRVIASDISADCLNETRRIAQARGLVSRMEFLQADATALPLFDNLVNAVVTRSVLIYVSDKRQAAQEFFRVLQLGGRVSLFEPINSRNRQESTIDWTPVREVHELVEQILDGRYRPSSVCEAMVDFNEIDLQTFFVEAGFQGVELERRQKVTEIKNKTPDELLRGFKSVGAPGQQSFYDMLREKFPQEQVDAYINYRANAAVDETPIKSILLSVYLRGYKPNRHG
jgi:SAM-dependent methyltransferase